MNAELLETDNFSLDLSENENPYNDINEYKTDINNAVSMYLDSLDSNEQIYNVDTFNGCISYIYNAVFKPDRRTAKFKRNAYCSFQTSILDYSDIDTLYELWQVYKQICSRFQKTFTVHQFCCMTGISQQTFREWEKRNSRESDKRHYEFCKFVKQDTESALYMKTVSNNSIGSMFALKCLYSWNDASVITIRNESSENMESAESIAERHLLESKPEIPKLEN